MIDKISALPKSKIGKRVGNLDPRDMRRLSQYLVVFLGVAE
jgi:mRNA interferase MazF